MRRSLAVSLAGALAVSWMLSGCVWFDHHHHDNGLHKGQYKAKKSAKK